MACRLRAVLLGLEGGWLAGLPHLCRSRNVDPRAAVDDEMLRHAAEVSVIVRRLDVR